MVFKRTGALLMLLLMLLGPVAAEETKTVTYRGITVSTDTEYVDLEKRGVTDWDGFYAFLQQLPNLKKVDMYNTVINLKVYSRMWSSASSSATDGTGSGRMTPPSPPSTAGETGSIPMRK